MIHLKLAWNSLKHHQQQYGLFILASAVLVALNFIFIALVTNSSLQNINNGQALIIIAKMCLYFVLILSAIFIFYVNSFLMKQRYQELGLFNILGLTQNDLRIIVFWENSFLYLVTVVVGLIIGASFLKLAFLVLQKLIKIPHLHEQFNISIFLIIVIIFAVLFMLIFLYDLLHVRRIKPIALWDQAHQGEKQPKNHWLGAIIGIILLVSGYFIAVNTQPNFTSVPQFTIAIIVVVIGTYLTFIATSTSLLLFLQKRSHFYYQPRHFIAVSGMIYRMKQNGAGLASICLLCTAILVTTIGSMSMYQGSHEVLKSWNPYDIMLTTKQPFNKQQQQQIQRIAHQNQLQLSHPQTMAMTQASAGKFTKNSFVPGGIDNSVHTLTTITVSDYNRLQKKQIKLRSNQILLCAPRLKSLNEKVFIHGHYYHVQPISQFKLYFNQEHNIWQPVYIIAANQKIAHQINPQPWVFVQGFNLRGPHPQHFTQQLRQNFNLDDSNCSSLAENTAAINTLFGGFLFLGIITCLAMTLAAVLMIYYKQVAEGYADRDRFRTMQQIGLSKQETRQAIHSQVLLVFMLPIIGATIHTIFALPAVISILKLFSLYDNQIIIQVALFTLAILVLVYLIVYKLTTKVYEHLVHA